MNATIKTVCEERNFSPKIMRAVSKQVGGWEELKEMAEDVVNHGASGGFCGFIYYHDTLAFTKRQKKNILDQMKESDPVGMGYNSLYDMIAEFGCISATTGQVAEAMYNYRSDYRQELYNALAWYSLEEACRSIIDFKEQ